MNAAIISVLYNQKLASGNTWNTLILPALSSGRNRLVILADNSTDIQIREENREMAGKYGAVYLDMQGNRGLPAAYNRAVDVVLQERKEQDRGKGRTVSEKNRSEEEWIVIADQDTCFPDSYLKMLEEAAGQTAYDVFAPVVKAGEKQLSPCCRKGSRFVPYGSERPEKKELQDAFFINTGLAFRKTLFEDPKNRYDEQLFLDFVDFDLVNRLRSRTEVRFGMLPGIVLQQEFSGTEVRSVEQDLERFRHFVHDGRLFYERWYGRGAAESAVRIRALKLTVKHRDIRFLKNL